MLTDGDYHVYLVRLPGDVLGVVRIDQDGFASVYINDQLTPKRKKAVLRHELRHITRCDHTNCRPITEVET